jgi:hypothetical protein
MLDVGTNTQSILDDPAYIGVAKKRDRTSAYDDLISEFVTAAQKLYGRTVLLQVSLCYITLFMVYFCCSFSSDSYYHCLIFFLFYYFHSSLSARYFLFSDFFSLV